MGNCVLHPADKRRRDGIGRAAAAFVAHQRARGIVSPPEPEIRLAELVLIIRHGEKPGAGDVHLAPKGYQRAGALSALFDAERNGGAHPAIDALFAATNAKESHRPIATLKPLARVLALTIDDGHTESEHERLAATVLNKRYDGKVVLICWRHGQIPALATALGRCRRSGRDERFDLIWRLVYSAAGPPTFRIVPQLLLYGDRPAG